MVKWKQIKQTNYEINEIGDVRNIKTQKIRKSFDNGGGYRRITLWVNNSAKHFLIHRLVAEAFIPNPNNLPEVNHKDENPSNNNVSNLEWCDRKYNVNYGNRTKKCYKAVLQYDLNGNFIKEWESVKSVSDFFGVVKTAISNCCNGRSVSSCGFIWKFK